AHFESPAELAMVTAPVAALANDVPGKALPQVLVLSASGGRLLTFTQTAPRTFAVPTNQPIALEPRGMGLADFDADGLDDLLVLSAQGGDLWYGEASGTFRFGESAISDRAVDSFTLSDLNGDGRIDIAASASTQD